MDLEVVGRHALLFDDDSMAEFVNSPGALVDWHSLSIDRYDVRHLLSAPPPLRSLRRRHAPHDESELDRERYLDLNSASDALDSECGGTGSENAGGYNAVPFSYGNSGETTDQKSVDAESGFRPPFSVPENLLQHLMLGAGTGFLEGWAPCLLLIFLDKGPPRWDYDDDRNLLTFEEFRSPQGKLDDRVPLRPPTEKVHQIIARTATFVSKHGGQSEIVLRVKQGHNPTFGFLMPDHELHPYFRFLVDHQDLIKSGTDGNPVDEEGKNHQGIVQTGGSLSLLGSVYGSVEDEEGPTEAAPFLVENNKDDASVAAYLDVFGGSDPKRDDTISKKDETSSKDDEVVAKVPVTKERKLRLPSSVKAVAIAEPKKESNLFSSNFSLEKLQASAFSSLSKMEAFVLEPSSDMKRVIDKIVEFILRNGREFEAVLVQQDSKHGRFPFLIPSNPYHPYYLKVLLKAQESRSGKKELSEKHESLRQGDDRKSVSDASNISPSATDIPHDSDRKERFKMVIGKLKKDGQDPASKATQSESGFSVDTAAAAAILQAATKGIKYPNLSLLSKASVNGTSSEGGGPSGSSSLHSSQSQFIPKPGVSVPVAKAIAKTVAAAAASEADSSEASLTEEQKLKAERLKRAKLFAAMIKTGAAPPKDDQLRALSVEPLESGCSGSGTETMGIICREREGSSAPHIADSSVNIEKVDNKELADVHTERRSKRSYRSRSIRGEEDELDDDEDAGTKVGGEAESEEDRRNHNHSRKKKRSHHSSHRSRDRHKRRRHSSSKGKEKDTSSEDEHGQYRDSKQVSSSDDEHNRHSRHRKKHHVHSDDEHRHSKRRHDSLSIDERHSRHKRRHRSSSDDDEHHHSRNQQLDGSSSDTKHQHSRHRKKHGKAPADEYHHEVKSTRHGRKPQSKKEADLEEGEILAKSEQSRGSEGNVNPSREASINISRASQDVSATKSTEVSDDLRAKVRAMLMATL